MKLLLVTAALSGWLACLLLLAVVALSLNAAAFDEHFPGRYEGDRVGSLTLGCALWDALEVTEYAEGDTANGAFLLFGYQDPNTRRDNHSVQLVVRTSQGVVRTDGNGCAISVDWSRFPRESAHPGESE